MYSYIRTLLKIHPIRGLSIWQCPFNKPLFSHWHYGWQTKIGQGRVTYPVNLGKGPYGAHGAHGSHGAHGAHGAHGTGVCGGPAGGFPAGGEFEGAEPPHN